VVRLLARGEWFDPLAADAVYEADYEALLLQQGRELYPGFHVLKFKKKVTSEFGNGIPDLCLIEENYRSWWVVEVELGSHPLHSHVESQVRLFASARYGRDEAAYLAKQSRRLLQIKLEAMMRGDPPRVLVLVNQNRPEWAGSLARFGALLAVVEVFRSDRNNVILRINGDQIPTEHHDVVTRCKIDPGLRGSLAVLSPAALEVERNARVTLRFQGQISDWQRLDAGNKVWLMPAGKSPLVGISTTTGLVLIRSSEEEGIMMLEEG
jgi:hypothetical protein